MGSTEEEKHGNGKQSDVAASKEQKRADHRSPTAESSEIRQKDSSHDKFHGHNHHSHRPFHHDSRAASSSPAPAFKAVAISERVALSSPRGAHSSTSTPPRAPGGQGGQHTFSPVVNPLLEKKREAQRETHRAYLKSNSDFHRAQNKHVAIEAELRLAEFWLDVVTKNLEDVGKRIEVHDWNFQKLTNADDGDEVV